MKEDIEKKTKARAIPFLLPCVLSFFTLSMVLFLLWNHFFLVLWESLFDQPDPIALTIVILLAVLGIGYAVLEGLKKKALALHVLEIGLAGEAALIFLLSIVFFLTKTLTAFYFAAFSLALLGIDSLLFYFERAKAIRAFQAGSSGVFLYPLEKEFLLTSPTRFDKASFTLLLLGGIAITILLGGCVVAVYLSAYGTEDFLNDPFFYLVFYLLSILAFTLLILGAYFDARDQVNGSGHRRNRVVAILFAGIAFFEAIALPISEFRGEQDKITYATYSREKWLAHKEKIYRASMIKDFVKQVSLSGQSEEKVVYYLGEPDRKTLSESEATSVWIYLLDEVWNGERSYEVTLTSGSVVSADFGFIL
jgi:hypothetical protein